MITYLNEKIEKSALTISLILIAVLIVFFSVTRTVFAETETSGTCGENATWELDDSGTLTIKGSGDMYDYFRSSDFAPWISHVNKIKRIVVESEINRIGDKAFFGCAKASSISIADSVTQVGERAFESCDAVEKIVLPKSVVDIENYAFAGCSKVKTIVIHKGVENIGVGVLEGCDALQKVHFTGSQTDWINLHPRTEVPSSKMEYEHIGHWDAGKVTQAPTCSKEGIKTYTCEVCGDTRTEAVNKDPNSHTWDSGKVIKKANEFEDGEMLYTCTGCGVMKSSVIPKTGGNKLLNVQVKVNKRGASVKWDPVSGADRYVIYLRSCDDKKITAKNKYKTVSASTLKADIKKLKSGEEYKIKVVSQRKYNGKYKNISKSIVVHFVTKGNSKHTNPKSIYNAPRNVSIKKGKARVLKAKVRGEEKGKSILRHAPTLRYASDNNMIAKVDSKGKIKAVEKGECRIYIYAQNGINRVVTVTVN